MPKIPGSEGSVYNLASRGGWHYAWTDSQGKRKSRKAHPNTERGAMACLQRALAARNSGEEEGRSPTLAEFVPRWLDIKATAGCRPRTIEAYRERLEKYVVPELGQVRLNKLTAAQLDALYAKLLKQPSIRKTGTGGGKGKTAVLSPSTVRAVHDTLRALLRTAKRRRLVGAIVTELVEPPKAEDFEARPLTVAEARALITGASEHRHGPLWIFMLGTGCRFGEAAGLTWGAVDTASAAAQIYQQATRERDPQTRRVTYVIAPVKTKAGRRVVPLPPFVLDALQRQRDLIRDMQELAGEDWTPTDLVFPSHLGKILRENDVLVTWHRACANLGLPRVRLHDLRHTKGTLMSDAGEDTTTIQRTLGHARQSITADLYIGNTPTALKAAADRYGKLLEG